MKKIFSMMLAAAALFCLAACEPKDDPDDSELQPTEAEQAMVTEDMTWVLDSLLVEYNLDSADYARETLVPGIDLDGWTYYLHPCTWSFPKDLYFTNSFTGEKNYPYETFGKAYCKYVMTATGDASDVWQAGYLEYYRDYFTFYGVKADGFIVMNIVEQDDFKGDNWQCSYNNDEDPETGTIYERTTEYYHLQK